MDCSIVTSHPDYPNLARYRVRIYEKVMGETLVSGIDNNDLERAIDEAGLRDWFNKEKPFRGSTCGPLGIYPWDAERVLKRRLPLD